MACRNMMLAPCPTSSPLHSIRATPSRLRYNGFTAVYAHLQPGSIRVKVGDRVKVGQVLGLLGNTGGSLAPHLHFHIVNGANGFTSDGYPYVLRSFALRGQADPALLTQVLAGKASFPHGREKPAAHKDELPLNFN